MDGLVHQYYNLCGFILPARVPPITGLVLARVPHACFIQENSIFDLNLRYRNPPGCEPKSQGLKTARLTIELHSIDYNSKTFIGGIITFSTKRNLFTQYEF